MTRLKRRTPFKAVTCVSNLNQGNSAIYLGRKRKERYRDLSVVGLSDTFSRLVLVKHGLVGV